MKRSPIVAISVLFLIAAPIAAQPPAEPAFAGRPLSAWIADLDSKDVLAREEAVEALARIGAPAKGAVEKLTKLYAGDEKPLRARCAWALFRIAQKKGPVITVIREALKDGNRTDKLQALERISLLGEAGVELTPALIDMWKDTDPFLAGRATTIVHQFGAPVLPALINALNHPDKEIQRRVLDQFSTGRFRKDDALPALRKKLEGADPRQRVRVARVIRQIDPTDQKVIPVLVAGTEHKDPGVRTEALLQCLNIFPRPKELADIFRRGMREDDPNLRFRCIQALFEMDRNTAKELLPGLLAIVKLGPGGMEWHQAVALLGNFGWDAKDAIPVFVQMLNDGKAAGHEHYVMSTLGRFGPEAADPLVAFAQDSRPQYRAPAAAALAQMGRAALERLGPLLKHDDANLRMTAFAAVHQAGFAVRPVLAHLESGLKDPNTHIRWMAAESLSRFGPEGKSAVPYLNDRLGESGLSNFQKAQTAQSLARIGPPAKEALPKLLPLLADADENVKFRAAEAVWRIEGKPDKALPALLDLLKSGARTAGQHSAVLRVLASLRADPAAIAKVLLEPAIRNSPTVRDTLVQTLFECFPTSKEFTPLYKETLKTRGSLRLLAAQALLRAGEKEIVIDAIKEALPSSDYNSKHLCYTLAVELGPDAKVLAPLVREQWQRESVFTLRVRSAEASLLADLDNGKDALAWLRQQLRDVNPFNAQQAAIVLTRVDPEYKELLPALLDQLKKAQPHARGTIIDAIGRLGPAAKSAAPAIKAMLKEREYNVHLRAAGALWRIEGKPEDVLPVLLAELPGESSGASIRSGVFLPTQAIEAVQLLAEMGSKAKDALPALRIALYTNDDRLRLFAEQAIRRIEPK